jgi:hypothetical protein
MLRRFSFLVIALSVFTVTGPVRAEVPPDFDRDVAPLFAGRCFDCHNPTDHKGGLDLTRKSTAMAGGDEGAVIVPGKPDESALWKQVSTNEMPPKHPLAAAEKEILRRWIAGGAAWGSDPIDPFRFTTAKRAGRDWWSLQPVKRPEAPAVAEKNWTRNPIDAFILQRLAAEKLTPSPEADRRTLIRRLTVDLTGLPPTPEAVDAFIKDKRPDAYERLVDQLLASPDYGVRAARQWLDLARFGESHGFERDQVRPNAWRYRDWVVDALNADMPYDRFARMQLAGDIFAPGTAEGIAATGFLVAGAYDDVGNTQQSAAMRVVVRQDELEDLTSVVGQTFLGLTVNCARCHDHKFDPISQREYYQLSAALAGVKHGERDLPAPATAPSAEQSAFIAAAESRVKQIDTELATLEANLQEQLATVLKLSRHPIVREFVTAASLAPDAREHRAAIRNEVACLRRIIARSRAGKTYACVPLARPGLTNVLLRGNPTKPADVVSPAGIAALTGASADFGLPPDAPEADRRRKLADWVTDPANPLFARVIVNRLWQSHFGAGLLDTPSDFGFNGGRPTHPELLDWLASELPARGWSMKQIHRLIVTSATYRQASLPRPEAMQIDASNRLLWRMSPRRIEGEMLRDAILSVAGELNPQLGGPGFEDYYTFTSNSTFYEFRDFDGPTFNRRSLYRTWIRSGRSPLLDVFDCPDPSTKTPRRAVTTTPLQALSLMNNSMVLRMSDRLAQRAKREAGENVAKQIGRIYELTLCRSPVADELQDGLAFVEKHGLGAFCRVMLNSSEFVCVD